MPLKADIFWLALLCLALVGCCQGRDIPPPAGVSVDHAICLAAGLPRGTDESSVAARDLRVDLAAAAGVRHFRWDFTWARIEPEPGDFRFEPYDRAVDRAAQGGIGFIGLLDYGNPWAAEATNDDDKYPPDDPADFAAFARATVERFSDRISLWEVWNEQNAGYRFWRPTADPAAYGALLKAAYTAAKQTAPDCQVAFGGTFFAPQAIPGSIEFIDAAYAAHPDLAAHFDVMAFHPYMIYPPAVPPESKEALPPFDYMEQRSLPEMIADIRAVMDEHDDPDKPIWITEVGWPEFETVPAGTQAAWLARTYLLSLAAGVEQICWYTLQDSSGQTVTWEDTFGLLTHDPDPLSPPPPAPKPAYHALSTLTKTLAGMHFDRDLAQDQDLPPGVHLLRFARPDRTRQVLAAWSSADPVTLDLAPSLEGYRFVEGVGLYGDPIDLGQEDGLEMEIDGEVRYLTMNNLPW